MSYDIRLVNKAGDTLHLDLPHFLQGGTYILEGTTECWLNITYNYSEHYYRAFGKEGIRTIYGMTGRKSIPVIEEAMELLGDECSLNYWESTEGNAKKALKDLLLLARARPSGIWEGD